MKVKEENKEGEEWYSTRPKPDASPEEEEAESERPGKEPATSKRKRPERKTAKRTVPAPKPVDAQEPAPKKRKQKYATITRLIAFLWLTLPNQRQREGSYAPVNQLKQ